MKNVVPLYKDLHLNEEFAYSVFELNFTKNCALLYVTDNYTQVRANKMILWMAIASIYLVIIMRYL